MMKFRPSLTAAILYIFLGFAAFTWTGQNQTGVLAPETENEARLNRLQPPDRVLDTAGIREGMIVAEIGAGKGRYVVQLAVRVGKNGKVFAEDIDAEDLDYLKQRCIRWGLTQVEVILGEVTDSKLPTAELDMILVISSYHHFRDPVTLLKNAKPALKSTGKLVIVEWIPWSRSDNEGTDPNRLQSQMIEAGYLLERIEFLKVDKPLNIYLFLPEIHDKK